MSPPRERPLTVLLLVFLGGALGSLAREFLVPALPAPWFWMPILTVNVLASFLIGWLFVLRGRLSPGLTHLLVGGFCGGFSTFSQFSYELIALADAGALLEATVYVMLACVLGIGAAGAGEAAARRVHGSDGEARSVEELSP
ncbi:MAG: CrcB family protein [Pseudomonadota bacterium]